MADNYEQEKRIRERAFEIWVEDGKPYGRDQEHWERAKAEIRDDSGPAVGPSPGP